MDSPFENAVEDRRKRAGEARFRALRSSFACCLSGLRATGVAADERRSYAEEDERESEACADPSVRPVDVPRGELVAGGRVRLTEAAGELRLADGARLRANELDLVA